MTAYAKEFEEWLSKSSNDQDAPNDEDTDDTDDDNNLIKEDDGGGGGGEDDSSQSSFAEFTNDTTPVSTPIYQLAPILVDDDDETNENDMLPYRHFEDEPPVLKPMSKIAGANITAPSQSPTLTHQESLRNYSRVNKPCFRQRSFQEKDIKTYSSRQKFRHTQSDDYEKRHVKNSSTKNRKESGNIFDKFLHPAENYDSPPPLIPSPEALKLHCESHTKECKHPGHTPDFCAMEADSTSELTDDKDVHAAHQNSLTKSSSDVLLECDSTCMLGASPAVVSPASVSCGESEDTKDSPGTEELVSNTMKNLSDQEVDSEEVNSSSLVDKTTSNTIFSSLQLQPSIEEKSVEAEDGVAQSFHDTNNNNDEPPTLALIPPLHLSLIGSRQKRHTIDAPETYSRTHRHYCPEAYTVLESPPLYSSPPTLTCFSPHDSDPQSSRKRLKKAHGESCTSKSHDQASKRKKRRHCSFPSANQSSFQSQSLQDFVAQTCLLSRLQTRMHDLLIHIFPQVKSDLKRVSPESPLLENVISDLISILEHCEGDTENLMAYTSKHQGATMSRHSSLSQAAKFDDCQNVITLGSHPSTTPVSSPALHTSPVPSCDKHNQQPAGFDCPDAELAIAQLSKLSLREPRPKSVVILLAKDPQARLRHFCQLSCKILQLLLPDLTVDLCDELAGWPADLLVFLENVLLLNTKKKNQSKTVML